MFGATDLKAARNLDRKVGNMGPRARRAADQCDKDGPEGTLLVVNAEGNHEGDRRSGRVSMNKDRRPFRLGHAVECSQAGTDVKGRLVGHEDLCEEPADADRSVGTCFKCLGGRRPTESKPRADGQPVEFEFAPPGEFQLDPIDPWQGSTVGREDSPGKVHCNRYRAVPGQLAGADAAVQSDDQVALLGALGSGGASDQEADPEEKHQPGSRSDSPQPPAAS